MIDFSQIKMTDKEKAGIRGNILRVVRSGQPARPIIQRSDIFKLLTLNFKPMMVGLTLMIALVASLGTGFAAEQALPGDMLYSVKTGVNERVSEVLAFSTEAKAEVEATLSERRLKEAAELAEENRFSGNARETIEANFERHANKVEARVKELEEKGNGKAAANISARFKTSLDAHARILGKLDGKEMKVFLPKIEAKGKAAATMKAEIESKNEARNEIRSENGQATTTLRTNEKIEIEADETAKSGVDNETEVEVNLRLGL